MKVCGISLQANEAIFVILEGDEKSFVVEETDFKKVKLENKTRSQEEIKSFYQAVNNFFKANSFDKIGIKERPERGQRAGGAVSFKIEALIQSCDATVVTLIHPNTLAAFIKKHELSYDDINAYQKEAKQIAYYLLNN